MALPAFSQVKLSLPARPSAKQKLRVANPEVAATLASQGAELIADYGSFQLFRASSPVAAAVVAKPGVEDVTEQDTITLNAKPLDTAKPEVQALRTTVAPGSTKRLHLVQFAGPVKPEWLEELERSGGSVVTYIPYNAYLVYADGAALAQVQAWSAGTTYVQWEAPYLDDYKIHPAARLVDEKGQPQKPATSEFTIQMVADPAANAETLAVIDRVKLEAVRQKYEFLGYVTVTVAVPAEALPQIAARPEVVSIQPYYEPHKRDERQDQILAGNISGTGPTGPGYLSWLASKGFTQEQFTTSGFAVDVSDSGIDNGTGTPGHFGLYTGGDTNQASRVIYNRLVGTPNSGSTLQGRDGHGTLNTHIIAGFNDLTGFPHTDSAGFRYGLGVNPFVKVGSSVIFDPDTFTSPNYPNLQSAAYDSGSRISANSWGANTSGGYNSTAQAYDALVRDAQPSGSTYAADGNQQMVIVFAAGNAGSSSGSVGAPGTAKNVITVGASENVRSLNIANGGTSSVGNDGCDETDTGADNANDVIDFSSRGPCSDGRKKPDLVAPGTHITGGVAQNSPPPSPAGTGSALATFDGTGVCALPNSGTAGSISNFFPLGQQFYTESSGTSHSTPAVAGAAALVRQYFINQGLSVPSPAITKAFLLNSTRYLTGVGANDTLWSTSQGFGEVNLATAFDGVARVLRDQLSADKFTATGQTHTWTGTVADPAKPFRVTLAWTDAPGSTSGNAYGNDLDLVVTVGGNTYKGNVFSGAYSVTGGAADSRNNVESVFLPAGVSGNYSVTVTAANINSDGVPNEEPSLDQDFALVLYNANEVPTPVVVSGSADIAAESCSPANGAVDPGETVTVNFSLSNAGTTNTTALVATLLATNGVLAPSGSQLYGSLAAGGSAVTQAYSFTASGVCGGTIYPTFLLEDGGTNLGTVTFSIQLGVRATTFSEDFDSVTAPALPSGWTTAVTGSASAWITTNASADTSPNAAFALDASAAGVSELDSPSIGVPSAGARLTFRHNYATESGYDGAVLEIKVGSGAWTDILAAGGSFLSGGYNGTITSGTANPLTNRAAWTGSSGGYVTTIVSLPDTTAGQSVQFRWRIGSDASVGVTGWFVDGVSLAAPICCGDASAPVAGFSATPLKGAAPLAVNFSDTSVGPITNRFWDFGNGVTTNTTATNFVFNYNSAGTFTVSLTAQGAYGTSTQTKPNYVTVTNAIAVLLANGATLAFETWTNGGIDPGETVTVNFGIKNAGSASTTNLVATLLASGGVTLPSSPQNFGALAAGGGAASLPFTFVASGNCGGSLAATLQLQDGPTSYGTVTYNFVLGVLGVSFIESFDGVTRPALPSGWTTTATGGQTNWSTSTLSNVSPPNAAFSFDAASAGVNELVSPAVIIPVSGGQLSFRNNYNLEASTASGATDAYDGGVLEIKIGTGAFADIITAGGSFVSGGYNRTITASSDPLNGRRAWSSTSGGFTNTLINLPAAAAGQTVQFKWRCGSDSSVSRPGWWIDDVKIVSLTCGSDTSPPVAGFVGAPLQGAAPLAVTFTDLSQGNITNRFWDFGNGATTNTGATNFVYTYTTAGTFAVSLTATGPYGTNTYSRPGYVVVTNPIPILIANGLGLLAESFPNGAVDPGETVTVSIGVRNIGTAPTASLVGTLLATGGITTPSAPQSYGVIAVGGTNTAVFSFTASGSCGDTNIATLQLQDGATDYGTVTFPIILGSTGTSFAEAFDGVTVPALPDGWTTSATGGQSAWVSSTTAAHTAPNAAYSSDASTTGVNELVSPVITLPGGVSQLSFWHQYDLEASSSSTTAYDGGVLEIKIGDGSFDDILAASGSFVSGGYTHTISSSYGNPLAGRQAWSGSSGGFTNTVVSLPAAAGGQAIQLRWRAGTDSSFGTTGWYVDTISLSVHVCLKATRPTLLWPYVDTNGALAFTLSGNPGPYEIETGTDLTNWTSAGTVTNVSGQVPFTYTNLLDNFRVFRARALP